MRILIINLTRFGDLLQSQPVVSELTSSGHSVGVVCLDNFSGAAQLLAGVDAMFPLHGGSFLAALDADWRTATGLVQALAHEIRTTFAPDAVINLTSTLAGRLLAKTLGEGLPIKGFGVDTHGFGVNGLLWTAFFEAASRRRGCSPFNIVDVFRRAAGLGRVAPDSRLRAPDPAQVQSMAGRLAGQGGRSLVALQLGASESRRQWPVTNFAKVGQELVDAGFVPVLVGSAAERPLAEAYAAASGHPHADFVGRTSLPELAALLSSCKLLITNDTGTMHLAAGLGVPCVALFLATAQPWDTGPYLAECLCLEPDLPCHPCGFGTSCPHDEQCRQVIAPEVVWQCAQVRLSAQYDKNIQEITPSLFRGARVWRSMWHGEGAARIMDLHSLSGHELGGRTAWLRLQRYFYSQFLDCWDQPSCAEVPPDFSGCGTLGEALAAADRAELGALLDQAVGLLSLVEQSGALVAGGNAPAPVGQRFLGAVHRLTALFEQPAPHGGFDALGRLWLSTTQERGDDLGGVVRLAGRLRICLQAWRLAVG